MECKFCHAVVEDDAKFCPVCGKPLTEEPEAPAEAAEVVTGEPEAPAEAAEVVAGEPEVAAEDNAVEDAAPAEDNTAEDAAPAEDNTAEDAAPVTEDELIPGDPTGKPKKGRGALLAIVCVLLAAAAACAYWLSKESKIPSERLTLSGTGVYTVDNSEMTAELAGQVVASAKKNGIVEQAKKLFGVTAPDADGLTNAQLALYYWENFYNYYNQNYYYAMYLGLEPAHMDESLYDEEAGRTWQEYFLTNALEDYRTYTAACEKAREEGFSMPDDVREQLNTIRDSIASRSDEELEDQLLTVYGPGVTRKDYMQYLERLFLGASYIQALQEKVEPTDEDLSAYYDAHAEEYENVPKDNTGTVNVRHILIAPADTDEDADWADAEQRAWDVYEGWLAGEATEENFSALATELSEDPGSAERGGLYENVYPGQMVDSFNDWCFDEARKPGDSGVVKTDYGFHVMYFVSEGTEAYWKIAVADACKSALAKQRIDEMALAYNLRLDADRIKLATPVQILESVAETADEETAGETAAESEAVALPEPGENELPLA